MESIALIDPMMSVTAICRQLRIVTEVAQSVILRRMEIISCDSLTFSTRPPFSDGSILPRV
jgi:hypothetical protein